MTFDLATYSITELQAAFAQGTCTALAMCQGSLERTAALDAAGPTLRAVIDPLDLAIGQTFQREEIPTLFGETFNPGNWHSGHVVLGDKDAHVLLVTLSKQGKAENGDAQSLKHHGRDSEVLWEA